MYKPITEGENRKTETVDGSREKLKTYRTQLLKSIIVNIKISIQKSIKKTVKNYRLKILSGQNFNK
jgi:hypothetical protein